MERKVRLKSLLPKGLLALIIIMPFHAFLTIWLGTATNSFELLQVWKEVLLILSIATCLVLVSKHKTLLENLYKSRLVQLIAAYTLLHLLLVVVMPNPKEAELLGLVYNLRFLAAFLVAVVAGFFIANAKELERKLIKIVLVTGAAVALFATVQGLFLPPDWLTRFGYGPETIMPYQPIQDSEMTRAISTLGGPNQLGAYLLLPLALSLYLLITKRDKRQLALSALLLAGIFFSHSRSAWLAIFIVAGLIATLTLSKQTARKLALFGMTAILLVAVVLLANVDRSPFLQAAIFHSSYDRAFRASSNVDHLAAIADGSLAIAENPLGYGPGNSGPASLGSQNHHIAESYYMQIGIETGLLGLALFVGIMYLVSLYLYKLREESSLAVPLLAAFWGVAFINFLLHGWTDSTISLIWWTLAGLAVSPLITKHKRFKKEKTA